MKHKDLSFIEAKNIAEKYARIELDGFFNDTASSIFEEFYLEAEFCWMFFRTRTINIPEENSLREAAYVVSRYGEYRSVVDYFDDLPKATEYLQVMSNYFKQRGSENKE